MTKATKSLSEEAVPVNEIKAPTPRSFRRFFKSVLVVFLSVLCVGAGVLIYQIHHRLDQFHPILPTLRPAPLAPLSQRPEPATPSINQTATESNRVLPNAEKQLSESKQGLARITSEDTAVTVIEPDPAANIEKQPEPSLPVFTLRDALTLRDHLNSAVSCREDLQTLLKSRIPGDEWNSMVEKLTPICVTDKTIMTEMNTLFRRNKKRAVIAYYHKNNPWWLAYLKAVSVAIIEIRRINPQTETPSDILSAAQNQLAQRDIGGTADLIRKLPSEMQTAFQPFLDKADDYKAAQQEVDRLILLFERKGK